MAHSVAPLRRSVNVVHRSAARLSAVLLLGAALLTACSESPTRSVQKFCDTYHAEKKTFTTRYAGVGGSGTTNGAQVLTGLLLGLQSIGDVNVILTKLDRVAPTDIEPDVAAVRDSWAAMQGTMGDEASNILNPTGMVGAVMKGLLASLQSSGSWQRVGEYISTNCDGDV